MARGNGSRVLHMPLRPRWILERVPAQVYLGQWLPQRVVGHNRRQDQNVTTRWPILARHQQLCGFVSYEPALGPVQIVGDITHDNWVPRLGVIVAADEIPSVPANESRMGARQCKSHVLVNIRILFSSSGANIGTTHYSMMAGAMVTFTRQSVKTRPPMPKGWCIVGW